MIELLKQHFDTAFAAPDGIEKLRDLILILAMRGKLVPQNFDDVPVTQLLEEIKTEKQRLIEARTLKSRKQMPSVKSEDAPYRLPKGWCWVSFDHIAENSKNALKAGPFGSALKKSMYVPDGFKVYGQEQVISGDENLGDYFIDSQKYDSLKSCAVKPKDILISLVGTIGKVLVLSEACQPGIINPRLVKISLYRGISREFIKRLLGSPLIQIELSEKSHGGTMNILNLGLLRELVLPFPPIPEQHRIVAKIDQLMARCDELEKLRAERDRLQVTVHKVACDRLLTAKDPDTFTQSWQFITQHFSELYSVKENVTELRKAILQLAIMGKLVEQDRSDEPVESLLHKIDSIKLEKIQSDEKIKISGLDLETSGFRHEIPDTWKWIKLKDLVESLTNGLYKPARFYSDQGVASIRMYNIQDGYLELSRMKRVLVDEHELEKYRLEESDLIVNRVNSRELVGKTAIVAKLAEPTIFEAMNIRVRFWWRETLPEYINLLFRTQKIRHIFQTDAKQASGQASISQPQVANIAVPLPPLSEQHRIVAKVDQLMTLCDTLEQQIDATTHKQTALLNAVINQI